MTEKLYDTDSHIRIFDAYVLSCTAADGGYNIVLDRTAFFPAGGGQPSDTGTLGGIPVTDVYETDRMVIHRAAAPISAGTAVRGKIDWEKRFRRMQNHSGEHIVSGLVYKIYGYNNVGFHMGSDAVTIDFDGILSRDDLLKIEYLANEAVSKNAAVTAVYPDPAWLAATQYRSKLNLTGNVRIVTVEGYDRCACCAPHVSYTGEIGLIKLLDFIHYKGGVRVNMLCGFDALDDYNRRFANTAAISAALSVKQNETAAAVDKLLGDLALAKQATAAVRSELLRLKIMNIVPCEGNLIMFETQDDAVYMRELANAGAKRCGGICAVFSGGDGFYRYVMASETTDLSVKAKEINRALSGRGGGSRQLVQGSVACTRGGIEAYFRSADSFLSIYG